MGADNDIFRLGPKLIALLMQMREHTLVWPKAGALLTFDGGREVVGFPTVEECGVNGPAQTVQVDHGRPHGPSSPVIYPYFSTTTRVSGSATDMKWDL